MKKNNIFCHSDTGSEATISLGTPECLTPGNYFPVSSSLIADQHSVYEAAIPNPKGGVRYITLQKNDPVIFFMQCLAPYQIKRRHTLDTPIKLSFKFSDRQLPYDVWIVILSFVVVDNAAQHLEHVINSVQRNRVSAKISDVSEAVLTPLLSGIGETILKAGDNILENYSYLTQKGNAFDASGMCYESITPVQALFIALLAYPRKHRYVFYLTQTIMEACLTGLSYQVLPEVLSSSSRDIASAEMVLKFFTEQVGEICNRVARYYLEEKEKIASACNYDLGFPVNPERHKEIAAKLASTQKIIAHYKKALDSQNPTLLSKIYREVADEPDVLKACTRDYTHSDNTTDVKHLSSLFSIKVSDVSHDVLAPLFCGAAKIVEAQLNRNYHYVLQKGSAFDLSGREHVNITPLQALFITGDKELLPIIAEAFGRICNRDLPDFDATQTQIASPYDFISETVRRQIMRTQILEIVKRSLQVYLKRQEALALVCQQDQWMAINADVYEKLEKKRILTQNLIERYKKALDSQDPVFVFDVHQRAQRENVFEGFDNAFEAIFTVQETKIADLLLFDHLSDSENARTMQKVNQLLEKQRLAFTEYSHQEIIVNRYHLLHLFKKFHDFDSLTHLTKDENYCLTYSAIAWIYLVGWVERDLAAHDIQTFLDPGLYDAVINKAAKKRTFKNRNLGKGDIAFPLSFDLPQGLGYMYALGPIAAYKTQGYRGMPDRSVSSWLSIFEEYIIQTQGKLGIFIKDSLEDSLGYRNFCNT